MDSDPLAYFAWSTYILFAILYSVFALFDAPNKKGGMIFTKRNAHPPWMVLAIHFVFLMILLELFQVATHFYYSLPSWLTDQLFRFYTDDFSTYTLLFLLLMVPMYYIERRWIFKEREDMRHTASEINES